MKKNAFVFLSISFAVVSLYLAEGCSKSQPNRACIKTITSPATAGAPVTFVSCASGVSAYSWSFGDGSTATGDSVLHTYATAGTYKGSLTVTFGGSTNTANFTVTVVPTGWIFNGVAYSVDSAIASPAQATLSAAANVGTNTSGLIVKFFPFPTSSGTYSYLVMNATNGNAGNNELLVILNNDSAGIQTRFGSTGSDSLYAVVGVSGGKVSVSLPVIEMVNLNNFSDSTTLSATFSQTR